MPQSFFSCDAFLFQVMAVTFVFAALTSPKAAENESKQVHYVTGCRGNMSITLHEATPSPDDVRAVFVYKGNEILGSDIIPAEGNYKNRLRISRQGEVTLSDVRLGDSGVFRVETSSRDSKISDYVVLYLPEPPVVKDGTLRVTTVLSPNRQKVVKLTCGHFTFLGYPPADVLWRDPDGRLLSSAGYEDGNFYLDMSDSSPPGNYTCFLKCHAPHTCCMAPDSKLLLPAQGMVRGCITCSLQRRVTPQMLTPEVTSVLQKTGEDMAAGMAALVNDHMQDTLDTHDAQMEEWKVELEDRLETRLKSMETNFDQALENKLREIGGSVSVSEGGKSFKFFDLAVPRVSVPEQESIVLRELQNSLRLLQLQIHEGHKNTSDLEKSFTRRMKIFQKKLNTMRKNVKRNGAITQKQLVKNLTSVVTAWFEEIDTRMHDWKNSRQLSDEEIFAKLHQTIKEVDDKMDQSRQKVDDFLENVTERVEKLHKNISSLTEKLQALEERPRNVDLSGGSLGLPAGPLRVGLLRADGEDSTLKKISQHHKEPTTAPPIEDSRARIPTIANKHISESCLQARKQGARQSGPHTLKPKGLTAQSFWCDMDTDDGGWLVFQRRKDGSVDFFRPWRDYVEGFGNASSDGEFWLGLDKVHAITTRRPHSLRVELRTFTGQRGFAFYRHFRVLGPPRAYTMAVYGYSGTAGDSLVVHNRPFSTKDRDNDDWAEGHCADNYRSGWWYAGCRICDLNAPYTTGPSGIMWQYGDPLWGAGNIAFTEMKIRPQL